jgi:predicted metal-dependent hydrolase
MIENSQPGGGYLLRHDGVTIPFRVDYSDRKHLAITVHPEMRLEVDAPEGTLPASVLARVHKRTKWIVRQWRYFERHQPKHPGYRYVSGESHRYLGKQFRLKVVKRETPSVKLVGRWFLVQSPDPKDADGTKELLERWYRAHAGVLFPARLAECMKACSSLKLDSAPSMTIRKMTHRWGSCTPEGRIVLNRDLILAPVTCIDYVIVHELCHLKVRNHSPVFYKLLGRIMPDWAARKERLERVFA